MWEVNKYLVIATFSILMSEKNHKNWLSGICFDKKRLEAYNCLQGLGCASRKARLRLSLLLFKSGIRHQCLRLTGRVRKCMIPLGIHLCKTGLHAFVSSDSVHSVAQTKVKKITSLLSSAVMLPFHKFLSCWKSQELPNDLSKVFGIFMILHLFHKLPLF